MDDEKKLYDWSYSRFGYQLAKGRGILGSYSVRILARVELGEFWARTIVKSESGRFGKLLVAVRMRLFVDGVESKPPPETPSPHPVLRRGNPLSLHEPEDDVKKVIYHGPIPIAPLYEVMQVLSAIESLPETASSESQPARSETSSTKTRKRERILEVTDSIMISTDAGVVPTLSSWKAKRFLLD